jgi:flagellar basal body-associated protein FliL
MDTDLTNQDTPNTSSANTFIAILVILAVVSVVLYYGYPLANSLVKTDAPVSDININKPEVNINLESEEPLNIKVEEKLPLKL